MQSTTARETPQSAANEKRSDIEGLDLNNKRSMKMILFVRSRRKCVSDNSFRLAVPMSGTRPDFTYQSNRILIYEDVLDENQEKALENAKSLARLLGLVLEVKDLSKPGFWGRLLGLGFRNSRFEPPTPSITIPSQFVSSLERDSIVNVVRDGEREFLTLNNSLTSLENPEEFD